MKRTRSGFTLIELLVVIAIIGLLSTLAVVALNSARQRSRDAKRVSDIRQIQTALELGFSETSNYPVAAVAVVLGDATHRVLCNVAAASTFQTSLVAPGACGTVFMGLVPSNPTPGGADYSYTSAAGSGTYSITFTLEGATGQLGAGVNCANQNGITTAASC
ncbi:MAG: type II secretion system protein [Patescibacteria group bacterium]|jgi:general secretion pathway protein G